MDPNLHWRPPAEPPLPPPMAVRPKARRPWLPAAIIGSAIVVAAGLVAGALILRNGRGDAVQAGPTTCESWAETRVTLRSIPALPDAWNWQTPNIDTYIKNQNAPVAKALDLFEAKIASSPADVAQAAEDYVAARRKQTESLSDHTYTAEVGAAVDTALQRLDGLCGIRAGGRPI